MDASPRGLPRAFALTPTLALPARALTLALVLPGLLALWGCSGEPQDLEGERALAELERLTYVPPGECRIPGTEINCANLRALLVDRFEVTRTEWGGWLAATGGGSWPHPETWSEGTATWPASYMTLEEARSFAAWRGMRLLGACEWMRVAAGTGVQIWPWEPVASTSVANTLDLGTGRPLPVGTFERGRTPLGTYDMLGNVWEWVDGRIAYPDDPRHESRAWAMGGSYLSLQRPLFEPDAMDVLRFHQRTLDPRHRAVDVGLRCAADAAEYLWAQAGRWGVGPSVGPRLRAVARGWGSPATALLSELARRPGAPRGLEELLAGSRE